MRKLRRLIISFLILIMSLALLSGNLMTVLAADTGIIQLVTIGKLPKEGVVGQEIDLGSLQNCVVRVKDPLGNDIELNDSKFTPTKAGYYNVNVYAVDGVFYEGFKINVAVDDAVILIPYNGAEIPTYINTGSDIKIPKASMVVYDEDGKIDQEKTDELNYGIEYIVTDPEGNDTVLTATEDDYLTYSGDETNTSGSYIVRYKASTNDNAVVKSTDFIVNVQEGFEDTEKPELKISGIPNSAPQRVKLTLPKATATDNKDEKVKITITVKDSDGQNVLEVDDSDPKNLVLGTEEVVFDNDNNRSFYPWKSGPYNVIYAATDDSGNTVESKPYSINISDTRAPVIELNEDKIPDSWAINVENASGKLTGDACFLVVPKPEVWDNVTPQEDIALYFSVKNSSGQFIYDSKEENQSSLYEEGFIDEDDDNYYLDFDVLTVKTGTFTLTFTARDRDANGKLKNSSYKAISIQIKEELKDTDHPLLQVTNIPQYIMSGDKFKKPALIPYDKTSKVILEETYKFINEDNETIEFDFEDKDYFIPETAGQIKITVKVQDSLGNKVLDKDGNEVESLTYTVDVYSEVIDTNAPAFKADSKWVDADNPETSLFNEGDLGQRTIFYNDADSKVVTVANITIESASEEYDFIGYEVIVIEPGKKTIKETDYEGVGQKLNTTVKSKVQFNEGTNKWELVLEKISFEVQKEGRHSLTIRAFNISGASTLATVTFDVEKSTAAGSSSSNGGGSVYALSSAATIPSELEFGEPFTLPLEDREGNKYITREIKGPAYEIMGNVFTPKAIGQFTISLTTENGEEMKATFTCVDTKSPEFKLLGEVPSYSKKYDKDNNPDAFIIIPEVSIIDKGTLKEYSVKVVDNNRQVVHLETKDGKEGFVPRVDGTYTITYTIQDAANTATYTLTIKVGDLIKPTIIDVSKIEPSATKFKQNDKLYVKELNKDNVSDNVTKAEDLKITRTLYGPNGNAISVDRDDKNQEYYTLKDAGTYTLTYTVEDEAGNVYTKEFKITVTGEGKTPFNYQILSTVLIITAVVLIVGVGVYFFRFRKIKES